MRAFILLVPVLSVSVVIACGGEFATSDDTSSGNGEQDGGDGAGGDPSGSSGGASNGSGSRVGAGGRSTGGSSGVAGGTTAAGGAVVCCGAEPVCAPSEKQVRTGDPCPGGYECHEVSMCCSTITCAAPTINCEAYPSCDPGDAEIVGACPSNSVCYARSMCGTTIHCLDGGTVVDGGGAIDAGSSCNPETEPYRDYLSTSPEQCQLMDFICVAGTSGFWNACGCGCEQPSWCPEWVNCMPGAIPFAPPPDDGGGAGVPFIPVPVDPCYDPTYCPLTGRAY